MRVAIYTRVSTADKGQTIENQVRQLRADCAARGDEIVMEESDMTSGTKRDRPGLNQIFLSAMDKEFDCLVVWSLDRLTREGAFRALEIIQNLGKTGVAFRSLSEPHFDTCGPFKDAIIAIAATLAKLEREKIVERVKAGLERTRAAGTVLGRPKIQTALTPQVLELHGQGFSLGKIAIRVNTSKTTVQRILSRQVAA